MYVIQEGRSTYWLRNIIHLYWHIHFSLYFTSNFPSSIGKTVQLYNCKTQQRLNNKIGEKLKKNAHYYC